MTARAPMTVTTAEGPHRILVLFRRDLRTVDHEALWHAGRDGRTVIPVYLHAPADEGPLAPGGASRWWLHHSLTALAGDCARLGSPLVIVAGPAETALGELVRTTGTTALYWTRRHLPPEAGCATDAWLRDFARRHGCAAKEFEGLLLHDPDTLLTGGGEPYKVYTPFWRNLRRSITPPPPLPEPARLTPPSAPPRSVPIEALGLLPRIRWDAGFATLWRPGAAGAEARLAGFVPGNLAGYTKSRDLPAAAGTTGLSPHLAFGEISIRTLWHVLGSIAAGPPAARPLATEAEALLRQLAWREFAWHILHHQPHTLTKPLRPEFGRFPWRRDARKLKRWQEGRTGFPMVDAGMRELWHTGTMHNRVRMLVASFLVKDLLIPWQDGAAWFWDTLLDADPANNTFGWQWTAGCGADAAPFFRVFNPSLQGQRFDADGSYVRRWVPEVEHRPGKPGSTPPASAYPPPMVDHDRARFAALHAYEKLRAAKSPRI